MVFVGINEGDMGVTRMELTWLIGVGIWQAQDFKKLQNKFNDTEHFPDELVNVYLQMEDDMEDYGMHRVLCKVLIDLGAIVYLGVLETYLSGYNGQ